MIKDAGYELYHAHRENKRGGGVAILYKKCLGVKAGEASTSRYLSFEFAFTTLTLKSKRRLLLVCVYRNQEIQFSVFYDEFNSFMGKVFTKGDIIMLVGDFNIWVDVEDNADAIKFLNCMNSYGLTQFIHEPTHRNGHTLDHVYLNDMQFKIQQRVINETMGLVTDHFPILIEIPSAKKQQASQTVHYRKMKEVDINVYKDDLLASFQGLNYNENFETLCSQFRKSLSSITNKHAPVITNKKKQGEPLWIDNEYRQCRATRRKLERKWKKQRTDEID